MTFAGTNRRHRGQIHAEAFSIATSDRRITAFELQHFAHIFFK
jgi:hypothetical protein